MSYSDNTPLTRKRPKSPSLALESVGTKISRQSNSVTDRITNIPPECQETLNLEAHKTPASKLEAIPLSSATSSKPCLIYIMSKKIPSAQLSHLKGIAKKKNFSLTADLK